MKYKNRGEVTRSKVTDNMIVYLIEIIENQIKNYNKQ